MDALQQLIDTCETRLTRLRTSATGDLMSQRELDG
jgi:hypothetical protein